MEDAVTSREIALAVALVLVRETETTTVKADVAEDPDLGLDQAALAAILLATAEDITREATLPRETRAREEEVPAAKLLRLANALAVTPAATAEEILALLLALRAPAMTEGLSLLERLRQMVSLQRRMRVHLRSPLLKTKLMPKSQLSEAR